ncbi:MAG: nucleotidyl transferase AbiEii/AbiGii toxin family protein [Flavobacteriales bacterium]|nr:nucleotidyl transferase AbiEii/AbiGii toxin family protein [Flavobacteriales bacterium]
MIRKREIEKLAEAQKVPKSTIDKDWVLGHFIDAIFSTPECRESLVFKGGTCLRKCYYPGYRFSEDLDFTSTNKEFVLDQKLLQSIADLITERTEIPLHIEGISPMNSKDKMMGYKAIVKFWGADHSMNQTPLPPERWTSSIKIEITLFELMVFPKEDREVKHPYSDQLSADPLTVPCYSLKEVLSEKLRALIQRSYTAPRDFYDIWHLSGHETGIDWKEITAAFHEKMKFKGLEFTGVDQMVNETIDKRVRAGWNNSLGHQIPGGIDTSYEEVRDGLRLLLNEIF